MFGFRTVRMGQRAAVWNRYGEVRRVDGPKLLCALGKKVELLPMHSAAPGEYLVVRRWDGRVDHLCGPASIWYDPVDHQSIETRRCIDLDANEAVVVYRREGEKVLRRIVRGPALFMPESEEWLHEFRWHGADPRNPDRKVPRGLTFTKLRVIPDQMYFNVEDVRTSDDALLQVRVMVFFELKDIDLMLDQTHDPIADFINALSADVIDFVAGLTFEQFKESTDALNQLDTYKQLVHRARGIGYQINTVVYRGYHAGAKLQTMHDNAIEARTQLKLEAETERQAQEVADMRLARDADRAAKRREMEVQDGEHKARLREMEHAETMRQMTQEQEAELEAQRRKNGLELERMGRENAERAGFLARMREMDIDLTRYLVAQYQNPDRVIRIEGNGPAPNVHVSDN